MEEATSLQGPSPLFLVVSDPSMTLSPLLPPRPVVTRILTSIPSDLRKYDPYLPPSSVCWKTPSPVDPHCLSWVPVLDRYCSTLERGRPFPASLSGR